MRSIKSIKELSEWKRNNNVHELINELNLPLEIPRGDLFTIISGGQIIELRGTYIHPLLISHIASWASPKFAVKVSRIINEQSIRVKDTKIDELIKKQIY